MQLKDKNPTSALKKISNQIEVSRKNVEADSELTENLQNAKTAFGQMGGIIKNQTSNIDQMKKFSKESVSQNSKNLELKLFFNSVCDKKWVQMNAFLEIVKDNFVISQKNKQKQSWDKIGKDFEKYFTSMREESQQSAQKMYNGINRVLKAKDHFMMQFFKLMLYKKNILWRDLNAPYDDYIHGEIKSVINLIKSNDQKYGYTPQTLQFQLPKMEEDSKECNIAQLVKIVLIDHCELIDGLKNYSKLSQQPQVIEDISKNQHIVKGLREKIEMLTKNYDNLMEKYRSLQISKGKVSSSQEKSLQQKLEQFQNNLIKKQQQIIELKQASMKQESFMNGIKQKNKQLQEQLSKWHKYQIPKIKEMQGNQKSILQEFNKVKRDLQTYTNLVSFQRQEKLKVIEELNTEKKRVLDLAMILGREKRKIKDLKGEIIKQEKINLELVDLIPE